MFRRIEIYIIYLYIMYTYTLFFFKTLQSTIISEVIDYGFKSKVIIYNVMWLRNTIVPE